MKHCVNCCLLLALLMTFGTEAAAKTSEDKVLNGVKVHINYDRDKIGPYQLEDPLKFADGSRVKTRADWRRRRAEILNTFAHEMYGVEPPRPDTLVTELVGERITCDGYARRRQYAMRFRKDGTGPCINWFLWSPTAAKGPVPVIILLNYRGAHEFVSDADIPVMSAWCRKRKETPNNRATSATRGCLLDQNAVGTIFPLQTILARGYAVMTACYCEVSPDPEISDRAPYEQSTFAYTGVFDLWGQRDPERTDNTTALGAWAWALSRGLDLAERIPELDARRAVVTGCSRLGKAALIAAARDERFAVCVPNQCGGGGVCLAKRDFGENVKSEVNMFSHWYCRAYAKYAENPAQTLPFDQHLFLAAIAPRPVMVQGMTQSLWMDTEGEYLSCLAAAPVWEFFGEGTMKGVPYPDDYSEAAAKGTLAYVRRQHGHGISGYDWNWLMNFADRAFARAKTAGGVTVTAAGTKEYRIDESQSLAEVNALQLQPGDRVLFKRGGVWRGQLKPKSGEPGNPIVYGAYGEGDKPVIEPSYAKNSPVDWQYVGGGLWRAETGAKQDIGNIVFNHGAAGCAFKRDRRQEVKGELDFWCDPKTQAVLLRSDCNPALRFSSLELCEKVCGVASSGGHDIEIDGLWIRYAAAAGIGITKVRRFNIRNCDLCWIGGAIQYWDDHGNAVRYGNGIEFWADAEDCTVERNRLWEIWDAALSNQSGGRQCAPIQRDIRYLNNEVWNCEYSFEYWQTSEHAVTERNVVKGNIFRDAGSGWGHRQRWNPNAAHLMFYDNCATMKGGYLIEGNVFSRSKDTLMRLFTDWRAAMVVRGNRWHSDGEPLCRYHGRPTKGLKFLYPSRLDHNHDDNQAEIESQGTGARVFAADELNEFESFLQRPASVR